MKFNIKLLVITLTTALAACDSTTKNTAPEFNDSSAVFAVNEDTNVEGSVTATDKDGDSLTYSVASAASHGVFELNSNGNFTYAPQPDFNGEDSVSIQVSDGELTSETSITFNVLPVNDIPSLETSSVTVTTSGETTGTLVVADIDGDNITFAIVQQPEHGTVSINNANGSFTYVAEELTNIGGSFTVSYTDNVIANPIEAIISLSPSYVTNLDKANYYYSSEHSHLKKAEAIKAEITDDTLLSDLNSVLASGYSNAGFTNKANAIFDQIFLNEQKGKAYRDAAEIFIQQGISESALPYLQEAEKAYNQHIADKGVPNISTDDVSSLYSLAKDYNQAGLGLESSNLLNTMKRYAEEVREDEYTTVYGKFPIGFERYSDETITAYLASKTESSLQTVLEALDNFVQVSDNTPPREKTSGDLKGQLYDSVRLLYIGRAAERYYSINQMEKAKEVLAKGLALYGITNYDENYSFEPSERSEANELLYENPLYLSFAPLFAVLYPELENLPFNMIKKSSYIASATKNTFIYQITESLKSGANIEDAITNASAYFTELNDYDGYVQTLVDKYSTYGNNSVVKFLMRQGYTDESLLVLNKASEILSTSEYLATESSPSDITGSGGCVRLAYLYMDYGFNDHVQQQAEKCDVLVDYLIANPDRFSTSEVISGYIDMLNSYHYASNNTKLNENLVELLSIIDVIEDDVQMQGEQKLKLSFWLAKFGMMEQANNVLFAGLDLLKQVALADENKELFAENINTIDDNILGYEFSHTGYIDAYNTMTGLRHNAATEQNFAQYYAAFMTRMQEEIKFYTDEILKLSDKEIADNLEVLIGLNHYTNQPEVVTALINHEINTVGDTLQYKAMYAELLAKKDDFSNTSLASIDTDNDGLPNFFLPTATEQEITASGLILDTDADNDGVADSEDPSPLSIN